MKKFAVIVILLVVCAGLPAGCNSPQAADAFDLYTKMSKAMADVKSIDIDVFVLVDVVMDSEQAGNSTNINIKQAAHSDDDIEVAINACMIFEDTEVPMNFYYKNGVTYSDTAIGKQSNTGDSFHQLPFMSHIKLLDFPEAAIKDFKISIQDGGKKVELTLDGNAVTSLIEKNQGAEDLNINDIICEFIVDENNILKSYRMINEISMKMTGIEEYEGITQVIKTDVTLTVNSYNGIEKINFPADLDEYARGYIG